MTQRERFIRTLKCEEIGGRVPHFELVFFLTMETLGKVHPNHRQYGQWKQMSFEEKKLHINDMAELYIETARRYDHSAIFVHPNPGGVEWVENTQWLLETIREKSGDEYYLMMDGDPTWAIPGGDTMMDFAVKMMEEPEKLNEASKRDWTAASVLRSSWIRRDICWTVLPCARITALIRIRSFRRNSLTV